MKHKYSRHIHFESVVNFRDLGGYRTHDGRAVAWRRLFRGGAIHLMSGSDIATLKVDVGPKAVIDLRTPREDEQKQEISLLNEMGAKYHNIPFRPDTADYLKEESELYPDGSNMGEVYLYRVRQEAFGKKVVEALEIIAGRENYPLLFHCSIGKDRTGVLAAIVLTAVGVIEEDIIADYTLSAPFMKEIRERTNNDPKTPEEVRNLPDFQWEATAESMSLFLSLLRQEYGSVRGYLERNGAVASLVSRLEKALLV